MSRWQRLWRWWVKPALQPWRWPGWFLGDERNPVSGYRSWRHR